MYDKYEQTADTDSRSPIVLLKHVTKYREQGGVSFELQIPELVIRRGQFIGLIGESGCGKSTLLDLLALVMQPSYVNIYNYQLDKELYPIDIKMLWDKKKDADLARLRRNYLGYVLQVGGLLPFLSVRRNIELPAELKGSSYPATMMYDDAKRMGVENLLNKKPQFLSIGQRQRIAILRALANDPVMVLADEPTAALDKTRAREIINDFFKLA